MLAAGFVLAFSYIVTWQNYRILSRDAAEEKQINRDAVNYTLPEEQQVLRHYLAIDQGPEAVMIENYRSGLLWSLFGSCPEIRDGLEKLGFKYNK